MNRTHVIVALLLSAGVAGAVGLARSQGKREAADPSGPARTGIVLNIYPQDFGMVSEVRPVSLNAGENHFELPQVSSHLDPKSVLLTCKSPEVTLSSHAYDLGASDSSSLLSRYVGRQVEVVRYGENGHEAERQSGKLLLGKNGDTVLQEGNKLFVNPVGTVVVPSSVETGSAIPKLTVQAQSKTSQTADVNFSYLTSGLSWSADYVAILNPATDEIKLETWATVTNQSGIDYPIAKVTLVAGNPNRTIFEPGVSHTYSLTTKVPVYDSTTAANVGSDIVMGSPARMQDLYAYPITAATSIAQERMNRLLMFSSDRVATKRDYSARMPILYLYGGYPQARNLLRGTVQSSFSFFNKEAEGLGKPLPQGGIRVYEPDPSGSLRYSGAWQVQNTPKDQKVEVTLSNAFDLFTESRLVKQEKVDKRTARFHVEVAVHNEKPKPVKVRLVQPVVGRCSVVSESLKHVKLNAYELQWTPEVPAGGKTVLTFVLDCKN